MNKQSNKDQLLKLAGAAVDAIDAYSYLAYKLIPRGKEVIATIKGEPIKATVSLVCDEHPGTVFLYRRDTKESLVVNIADIKISD